MNMKIKNLFKHDKIKKAKKEKEKENLKIKEKNDEILKKHNDEVYKEMISYEKKHKKEEKVAPADAYVSLEHINKIYANHVQAVYDFSLNIKKHEFIVFVGPSGCGKSTTLRMIAGLEDIISGDLFIDGTYANDLEPKDRDISMVFQSYALYPHMSVYNNMAFGLKMNHVPKDEIDERVNKAAQILELTDYLDRKPRALSGGQCQRVALGRAIVRNSKLFLMDEPLSNLDAKLRVLMRSEIVRLHKELGSTTIYVTHDQTEAMTMADRIVVMKKGHIQQIGTPKEIYNHPENVFVATFIGSPAMNILKVYYDNGKLIFKNGFTLQLDKETIDKHQEFYKSSIKNTENKIKENEESILRFNEAKNNSLQINELVKENEENKEKIKSFEKILKESKHDILFGIRPEDMAQEGYNNNIKRQSSYFDCEVSIAELLGHEYYIHTLIGKENLIVKVNAGQDITKGEVIRLSFDLDKFHLFDEITNQYIW